MRGAFTLAEDAVIEPNSHYIVVDDVFTTGATLNACAKILKQAGAQTVDVITIGHG